MSDSGAIAKALPDGASGAMLLRIEEGKVMRHVIAALSAGLATLAPAVAQAQIRIAMGEEVVAMVDSHSSSGGISVSARTAASPNAFEKRSAAAFASGAMDGASGPNAKAMPETGANEAPTPVPVPGRIRLRFTTTGAGHSMLVIENGYSQAMVYRARMHRGTRAAATDVCLVVPGKIGLEHWPYPLDAIELDDIRLVPWKPEDGVRCE